MTGVGESLQPLSLPVMPAVLVNPRIPVATKDVFAALGLRNGELHVGVSDMLDAIMWPDTIFGPTGIAAQFAPFNLLPLDEDIADQLEREYCAPKADGTPKPIEPRPPELIHKRGWLKRINCAAHI